MDIEKMYVEEISSEFEVLNDLEAGSEEYCKTINGIATLTDKFIALKNLAVEAIKTEEERKDRKAKNGIAIANVVVPATLTTAGMILMFIFEERGSIVSRAGSKIVDRIFRAK